MEKPEIYIPREPRLIERTADIAAGYILIAGILALTTFCGATTMSLIKIERALTVAARV
jgi:hypothetical protein